MVFYWDIVKKHPLTKKEKKALKMMVDELTANIEKKYSKTSHPMKIYHRTNYLTIRGKKPYIKKMYAHLRKEHPSTRKRMTMNVGEMKVKRRRVR